MGLSPMFGVIPNVSQTISDVGGAGLSSKLGVILFSASVNTVRFCFEFGDLLASLWALRLRDVGSMYK